MDRRILLSLLLLFAPFTVRAQVGSTTDILTGRVTGPDGKPLANIQVSAQSASTGITRKKQTDNDGRYTIVFPDGGGQYRLTVRAIGFEPVARNIARQSDEDRLITDVQIGAPVTAQLAPVQVNGTRGGGGRNRDRPTPGESGRNLTADQLAHLPVDQSDLSAIAALAPGVIPVPGTDSTAAAFSVAGQRSTLNNVTLDGLSFGSFSVPQEGLGTTRVITNTYDPSRGQFSGGQIASTTRSGTNELTGGVTYSLRDPSLEFKGPTTGAFSPLFKQDQVSAGLGGPIIKDKLFIFASGQFRRVSNPFESILSASPATLGALGVEADSANQFINAVNGYGIPSSVTNLPGRHITDNTVGLIRVDYFLNDNNTLTLRGDYRHQTQDPSRNSPLSFPTSSGTNGTTGSGLAATLTSTADNGLINEFKAYLTGDVSHADPFLSFPVGRVRVTSLLPDQLQGVSVLGFGGNASFPQSGSDALLEMSDELSYLTRNRAHRVKLGALLDVTSFDQQFSTNQFGTFTYNSLQDFLNNAPDSYTRTLTPQKVAGKTTSGAVYLGDTWIPRQGTQIIYGFRVEGTHIGDAPPLNTDVQQLFGLRTNNFPSEIHVSPRIGFSMNLTRPDSTDPFAQFRPAFLVRGGIGDFRAKTPTSLFTSAQQATGLANAEEQVVCIGPAVPTPTWSSYDADPTTVPTQCVDQGSPTTTLSAIERNVTVLDPTFKAPRAERASLGFQRRLFGQVSFSADASYARGISLYGVTDLNLNTTPAFYLSNEGNRPVYAPASAIVTNTGVVSSIASRRYSQYGNVFEISSNLQSSTKQLLMQLNGSTTNGTLFNLSYTLSNTRDQSTFTNGAAAQGFSSPTTASNPNLLNWAPGDMDIRHIFQGTVTKPITSALEWTAIGRLSSGSPFTPLVGSDINGDGSRNDRAFIFNPTTTTDPATAAALQQLLAAAPGNIRDCLENQLGTVASRNSCRGPWTPSLDFQLNLQPQGLGMHGNWVFSLITANFLAGLDELLHGSNIHGWGQPNRVDPVLLYVRDFDPTTNNFQYDVNERFGSTDAALSASRVPFVVALQARMTIGPSPRDRFRRLFSSQLQNATNNASAVVNPVAQIIAMRETLQLTQNQVDQLTTISDSLAAKTKTIGDTIRAIVARSGSADPRSMFSVLRPHILEGRQAMTDALAKAQTVLTKQQWDQIPPPESRPSRARKSPSNAQPVGERHPP